MRLRVVNRIVWALLSAFAVESLVFGLAVLPAVTFWEWHLRWPVQPSWARTVVLSMAFIPAYIIFAVVLMVLSAATSRLFGWRTPADAELRLDEAPKPLLDWVRYAISTQLVRIFAGPLFRATPIWTYYMRLNGARLGRRVYINSLRVTDHNLLEFDDDVVVGGDVHLSGHTVERGVLKTARVRLGRGVTVGVGSVVSIGVDAGDGCQIGALSFVPKFSKLEANGVYVGTPVRKLEGR